MAIRVSLAQFDMIFIFYRTGYRSPLKRFAGSTLIRLVFKHPETFPLPRINQQLKYTFSSNQHFSILYRHNDREVLDGKLEYTIFVRSVMESQRGTKLKAVSLFSGAGGMDLGFKNAGYDLIAAYDYMKPMVDTYNKNLGGAIQLDLSSCDFSLIADKIKSKDDVDILIGGPPCQGFTSAGTRFWDDPRNSLVRNYVDALKHFHPRWFVMENVEGILTTARGIYLYETIKKMVELGYSVFIRKIYMQEYGVPQRRKRVFIVGNNEGKKYSFPKPVTPASGRIYRDSVATLRNAIEDLQDVYDSDFDQEPHREKGIKLRRIETLEPGQSMKDLPRELQHKSFKRRAFRRVMDGTPSAKRGGAPNGLRRLVYDEPCLTITSASPNEFVHPVRNRMLTIRECARVQTFPDEFRFFGKKNDRIVQIGNAVPPKFAEQLAKSINISDMNESEISPGLISYDLSKTAARSSALMRTEKMLGELTNNQLSFNY